MTVAEGLPTGTVTLLFTDIEGSTQLLKQLRDRYGEALGEHQRILREAFGGYGGHEIDTQGDSFFVAFRRTKDAVSAAIEIQRQLDGHAWPDGSRLRVRVGIHTGEPLVGGDKGDRYVGLGVHRGARICAAGHGGQVLVSQTARELLRDDPIPDVSLRDLGEHQLKDMDEPEHLYQLVAPGLEQDFPALKTAAAAPFEGREGELAEAAAGEMTGSRRRPGRRALIVAAAVVVLAGVGLGALLTRGGGSPADAAVAPNSVGVIDAKSGKIVSEIEVGGAPGEIVVGPDAVWVTNANDNTVSRIDSSTNNVRQTIQVGGGPAGVAAGAGAVWVANGLDGTVSRIDPTINQVVGRPITVGNGPDGVAYGAGAVWVANSADGTVSRIDPAVGRVTKTFPAVIGASAVAVGFGRVWVVSPSSASVIALDPRSGRILHDIGVGHEPSAVAADADAVWVTNRADDTVSRIDPRTAAVKSVVPVGRGPAGIAAGSDGVWVTNGGDGSLYRIDATSGAVVERVHLANPPRGVALGPRGVYVAVQSTGIEHRGGTLRVLRESPPDFIDPAMSYDWTILTLTNDGLVGFRRVGGVQGIQLVPNLAVSLPRPTDGGKTYTFQVRPGIRYSNGRLVQPEDFRRAIERVLELGSPGAYYYAGIVGAARCAKGKPCDLADGIVTDPAARTVSFHLSAPDAELLDKLALPFASAVPAGTPAREVGSSPLPATGPYRIAEYRKQARTLRLVRNPSFREWSADAHPNGYPDVISFTWASGLTDAKRVSAVERGAADVAARVGLTLSERELEGLAVRAPGQLKTRTQLNTFFFFLNTRVPPFDDVRARRAVNIAFDREAFARTLGRAYAPTCQILPPNIPGYRRACPYASTTGATGLDRARLLVRKSGTRGTAVTVWAPIPMADQGRYLVSVLEGLGFRARLESVPPVPDMGAYFNKVADTRVGAQTGWAGWIADYPSTGGFIPPMFGCAAFVPTSPEQTTNVSEFCDPAIDAKMSRAVALQGQDPPAATLLWQEIERDILAQAPTVPTVNPRNVDFVSERVANYQYNPQWGVLLDQLWVK